MTETVIYPRKSEGRVSVFVFYLEATRDFCPTGHRPRTSVSPHRKWIRLQSPSGNKLRRIRGSVLPEQTGKEDFMPPPAQRERLRHAHFAKPSSIKLEFADKKFTLKIAKLGMPIDRIRWETVVASPAGDSMTVQGIKGEKIPIDSSTLRYFVDPLYAAEMDAALKSLQFSREELKAMARDNPPPPELFAQPEQDLTNESWK